MSAAQSGAARKSRRRQARPYVVKVNEESGTIYLERERHPLFLELPYVAALVLAVTFALFSCCRYIKLRTDVECRIRETQALERQVVAMQNDNDLAEKDVAYIHDLNTVYEIATQTLGMVPVSEANVLFFDRRDSEYVYQDDNIPTIRVD